MGNPFAVTFAVYEVVSPLLELTTVINPAFSRF